MSDVTEKPEDEDFEVEEFDDSAASEPEGSGKAAKARVEEPDEDEDELADLEAHEAEPDPEEHDGTAAPRGRAAEQRLRRQNDRLGSQMAAMAAQMAAIKKAQTDQKVAELFNQHTAIDNHLRGLVAQKAQAFARQDYNTAAVIDEQLLEARARKQSVALEHDRIKFAPAEEASTHYVDEGRKNSLARSWTSKRPWLDMSTSNPQSNFVREASLKAEQNGYSPDSPEHYAELDRLVKARFPNRYKGKVDPATGARQKPRSVVAGSSSSGAAPSSGGARGKLRVPSSVLSFARQAGLDTNDKATLKRLALDYQANQKIIKGETV